MLAGPCSLITRCCAAMLVLHAGAHSPADALSRLQGAAGQPPLMRQGLMQAPTLRHCLVVADARQPDFVARCAYLHNSNPQRGRSVQSRGMRQGLMQGSSQSRLCGQCWGPEPQKMIINMCNSHHLRISFQSAYQKSPKHAGRSRR